MRSEADDSDDFALPSVFTSSSPTIALYPLHLYPSFCTSSRLYTTTEQPLSQLLITSLLSSCTSPHLCVHPQRLSRRSTDPFLPFHPSLRSLSPRLSVLCDSNEPTVRAVTSALPRPTSSFSIPPPFPLHVYRLLHFSHSSCPLLVRPLLQVSQAPLQRAVNPPVHSSALPPVHHPPLFPLPLHVARPHLRSSLHSL